MIMCVKPTKKLTGRLSVPGDKSISHRAVMIGALAEGDTVVKGFLPGEDCLSTVNCMRALGIPVTAAAKDELLVSGKGLCGLREPEDVLNVNNSGTTIRLLSGILAGQDFTTVLTGDASIRKRPMKRVTGPLKEMGAVILGRAKGELAPLTIRGGNLRAIRYESPVSSAQVKSAVLLAGLFATGCTEVVEPAPSRDHTEIMLQAFGAKIETGSNYVRLESEPVLRGQEVIVPGDISSAAFLMTAALIVPQGRLVIDDVGLNRTRSGIIEVLQAMGAKIEISNVALAAGEKRGTITVESSSLRGVSVGGEMIPRLIDEIPVLAVAALFASGVTEIRDAAELKVKESNRISAMAEGITRLGGRVEELPDGLRIYGGYKLKGARCQSHHDHRIAMAFAVAALQADGETCIEDAEAINISYPGFMEVIESLKD